MPDSQAGHTGLPVKCIQWGPVSPLQQNKALSARPSAAAAPDQAEHQEQGQAAAWAGDIGTRSLGPAAASSVAKAAKAAAEQVGIWQHGSCHQAA